MTDGTVSTDTANAGENNTTDPVESGKKDVQFEAITSQDELDRIVQTRLARERSKYADYDALKERASKYDQIEEASKTEVQRALERAEKAEKDLAETRANADRLSVIASHQIPEEYQELITATELEGMKAQAIKIQALIKPKGPIIPTQGKEPTTIPGGGIDDILRAGFNRK